jgi:hypothetical protein
LRILEKFPKGFRGFPGVAYLCRNFPPSVPILRRGKQF